MKKVSKKWLVLVVWLVVASSLSLEPKATAGSVQCAWVGDLMVDVLNKCGEPSWVESREETTVGAGFVPFHTPDGWLRWPLIINEIERWIYNFGPTRFMWILTFENGILKAANTGGYGF